MLKTMVFFPDVVPGGTGQCDTIEYEGRFWLVPFWKNTPDGRWRSPARIIPLDQLAHQDVRGSPFGDFVLTEGIPKALFDGDASMRGVAATMGCIENPEIRLPTPGSTQ
jgi:hypothetical protein